MSRFKLFTPVFSTLKITIAKTHIEKAIKY